MARLSRRHLIKPMRPEPEKAILVSYLRGHGLRLTRERLAIFEEIFRQHGHVDADELHETMRRRGIDVSRATVYRNLDLLVECDLVRKHRLGRRRTLYEHVHPGQEHDHLMCRECGRVVEFVSPGIRAMQQQICKAHGFVPEEVALQISSRCVDCAGR